MFRPRRYVPEVSTGAARRGDAQVPAGTRDELLKRGIKLVPQAWLFWPQRELKTEAELKLV